MEYYLSIWILPVCYIKEPWNHYAKWKKPDTRDHILYDSVYIKYIIDRIDKSIETERLVVGQGWGNEK